MIGRGSSGETSGFLFEQMAMKPKWMNMFKEEIAEIEAREQISLDIIDRRSQFPNESLEATALAVGCGIEDVKRIVNRKPRTWRS